MFCQVFCSCTMWSKLRKKVLKNRSYELQPNNAPFSDLEDDEEGLDSGTSPSRKENRRSTNGFTKCLIPHLSASPIGCGCGKKNISPTDTPIPGGDNQGDKPRSGKDAGRKWAADTDKKSNTNKSKDKSLSYYFKETDSGEVVRKNKSQNATTPGKTPKAKSGDKTSNGNSQNTQMPNKKPDNSRVSRSTSVKDKTQTPAIFSAGQREIKSGIDFKEFQRVFENSQESIADQTKTVTFGTFGKDLPDSEVPVAPQPVLKKQPPLFTPRPKKVVASSPEIPIVSPTLLDSSLTSSKGASLTSEEGAESGYGTQDDGTGDRLARSISSNSDCNDGNLDLDKSTCSISRESTGEEDVFQHFSDNHTDTKMSVREDRRPLALTPTIKNKNEVVSPNRNVVVAEIHAENFDEPRPCASRWRSEADNKRHLLPRMVDKQNNNAAVTNAMFDLTTQKNNNRAAIKTSPPKKTSPVRRVSEPRPPSPTESDSDDDDKEDIREYLPADVGSMSEVFNASRGGQRGPGHRGVSDLYASVPRHEDFPPPPSPLTIAKMAEPTPLSPRRPDVIDCHDLVEPMVTDSPPEVVLSSPEVMPEVKRSPEVKVRPISPEGSEDETILDDEDSFSEDLSNDDDGDSGPPLPSRNYSNNSSRSSRDGDFSEGEIQHCEAPTLALRGRSRDRSESMEDQPAEDPEEITSQEEPIHMTWDEVMKEARTLGIPLSPPAATLDRRLSSASSQDSTPLASPVRRLKHSASTSKKRSPFKDKFKLQNLFTLRRSKPEKAEKSLYNRRSAPAYDGTSTTPRTKKEATTPRGSKEATTPRSGSKSCVCGASDTYRPSSSDTYQRQVSDPGYRSDTYRPSSSDTYRNPVQYTYYTHHTPRRHQMNVSINVSVISGNSPGSPEVMTQSMIATQQTSSPQAQGPGSPGTPNTLMSRSLISHHSMSNQSLSQHSVLSGQSAHSYQSAHSATSIGSPNNHSQSPAAVKAYSPSNSPSYHGNHLNGVNQGTYGTSSLTMGTNGYYSSSYGGVTPGDGAAGNADFIGSLLKLKDCGWYWGPLGWDDAESKLLNKPDGSFLVRDSSDDRYILSLSFRSQGTTHHTRIEHYKGMFSFYSQPKSHGAATIVEFIEKAMEHSRNGKFLYFLRPRAPGLPPAPVQLLYPVSRLQNMQSLQHMCRFVILKQVRKDHIDRLPIPPRLKEYLKQNQYYTEYLGGDGSYPLL